MSSKQRYNVFLEDWQIAALKRLQGRPGGESASVQIRRALTDYLAKQGELPEKKGKRR